MRTEIIKEEFGEINGHLQITLTLRADVDPDDIQKQLAARRVDQTVRRQVREQEQRLQWLEEQLRKMTEEIRSASRSQSGESEQHRQSATDRFDIDSIRARANNGDADAQYFLGAMYQLGRGVPKSEREAAEWFRKAAEKGNAFGQTNLACSTSMALACHKAI